MAKLGIHQRSCPLTAHGQEALHGVVELDESYIGGTDDRAHKGRSLAGCKALTGGAVEVLASGKMGRIRMEHLAAADAKSLESFAVRNIEQHAVARTDGLASYNNLPMVGIGHQRNVIGPDSTKAVEVLPNINKVFSLFKRVFLGTFQGSVSHKHLWAYLDEFVFRINRRNSDNRWLLFERIVTAAPRSRPPTMTQITHRAEAPT